MYRSFALKYSTESTVKYLHFYQKTGSTLQLCQFARKQWLIKTLSMGMNYKDKKDFEFNKNKSLQKFIKY